jgi:Tol biopolymer transport system component/tRNA A-37 threonylcarbamoyl transferase component Bud32
MALSPGAKLGPYEVREPIGAGGMGEVYRATDTRLGRTVAIKILPEHLARDPERRERFEREARAVSSLNHPHICTLHDIGRQDGVDYIVMEYVEGETLQKRLERGRLGLSQTLQYAVQIADALDKTHRAGAVHRDLKPGNIILSKSGAKLLDFGLAKLRREEPASPLSQAPTADGALTGSGTILGTLQYMAPEQLEGKDTDARTDIFAFGAVLYECLTGERAFEGGSQASLISAIMSAEPPPLAALDPMTPAGLDRIVRRCLAKNPEDRWQSARDLALELSSVATEAPAASIAAPARRRVAWIPALLLVALVAAGALLFLRRGPSGDDAAWKSTPIRFTILPPEGVALYHGDYAIPFAPSPDGRHLVFAGVSANGQRQLWLRPLDSEIAQPLAGTEGADAPFWSPDGQWIGFYADGKLKKVRASGGSPATVADVPRSLLATWNGNDVIVLNSVVGEGLLRVSAQSGTLAPVTTLRSGEIWHLWPQFLKDGRRFVYAGSTGAGEPIYVASLDGGEPRLLMDRDFNQRSTIGYAPGYILFARDAALFARPFDEERLEFSGEPVRVVDGIPISAQGRAPFAVSPSGVLAYSTLLVGERAVLKWFRRDGAPADAVASPARYSGLALSPDGRRLVFSRFDAIGGRDVWLRDLQQGVETKLTADGDSMRPIFSKDGASVVFSSARANPPNLYTRVLDGGGGDEQRSRSQLENYATSWSSDKAAIVYESMDPRTKSDLWSVRLEKNEHAPLPLNTPFNESAGALSPDGRWLAYVHDGSGRAEVWVANFPSASIRRQVSGEGGEAPEWRGDGKELELFYVSPQRDLMSVALRTDESGFATHTPKRLFHLGSAEYRASADGSRFLAAVPAAEPEITPIHIILNWPALLPRP